MYDWSRFRVGRAAIDTKLSWLNPTNNLENSRGYIPNVAILSFDLPVSGSLMTST